MSSIVDIKRKKGRPKGSKNKALRSKKGILIVGKMMIVDMEESGIEEIVLAGNKKPKIRDAGNEIGRNVS